LQVSHHPPVSALYGTDHQENIDMTWCHSPVSKFNGINIDIRIKHFFILDFASIDDLEHGCLNCS